MKTIDFHTHVFPPGFRNHRDAFLPDEPAFASIYASPKAKLAGAGELLSQMDEGGVSRSVIFGFPWEKNDHYRRHNDYILEAVERYPDRLIGFCCFSPRSRGGAEEAARCLNAGMSGVGELAFYGSDLSDGASDALEDVMAVCFEHACPLLLHTNEPVGHAYPGKAPMTLRQIYRFVKKYPSNRIVLAHWGGGLFFYSLMKKEVKGALKNVWFDTAASPFLYLPGVYRLAGELVGYDKILFGSDYPLLKPERYFKDMQAANLPEPSLSRIRGLNAMDLLGLNA